MRLSLCALALVALAPACECAVWYVSAEGDDAASGAAPESAWRTIERVNRAELAPGDTVLLRRGDTWRGQLRPRSGAEGSPITYGAFGLGGKPTILGSLDLGSPAAWTEVAPGSWETRPPSAEGASLLGTPGAPEGGPPWVLYYENGADASMAWDATDGVCRVRCTEPGGWGSDIQVFASPFPVAEGQPLEARFSIRCDVPCELSGPALMQAGPPWTSYSLNYGSAGFAVTSEWREIRRVFGVRATADDGRLTFFLGKMLPAGATLQIRDLTLRPCSLEAVPMVDVGNVIFDGGEVCGAKRFEPDQLMDEGDYWYDEERCTVRVRCDRNPGERWGSIEAALRQHIIDQTNTSWVVYEDLRLLYGGAHGIGGGSTSHIVARSLDIGWIGGGDQMGGPNTVRFGNGIEFWGPASDGLVEGCHLWQIYDAALTNQNLGATVTQRDITYRGNLIEDSEYSFEYWNRPGESVTEDIVFEHNTCLRAGWGWGHTQRPDPSGRHLCFYTSDARESGIVLRDNIFAEAREHAFSAQWWSLPQAMGLSMSGNLWCQPEGEMVAIGDGRWPMASFADYLRATGLDAGSLAAAPVFVDPELGDWRLAEGSPGRGIATDGADPGCGALPQ